MDQATNMAHLECRQLERIALLIGLFFFVCFHFSLIHFVSVSPLNLSYYYPFTDLLIEKLRTRLCISIFFCGFFCCFVLFRFTVVSSQSINSETRCYAVCLKSGTASPGEKKNVPLNQHTVPNIFLNDRSRNRPSSLL